MPSDGADRVCRPQVPWRGSIGQIAAQDAGDDLRYEASGEPLLHERRQASYVLLGQYEPVLALAEPGQQMFGGPQGVGRRLGGLGPYGLGVGLRRRRRRLGLRGGGGLLVGGVLEPPRTGDDAGPVDPVQRPLQVPGGLQLVECLPDAPLTFAEAGGEGPDADDGPVGERLDVDADADGAGRPPSC